MNYAKIIVDLSAEAVDRLFTYAVPEDMTVQAGHMVEVPFGPRTLEGFVISVSDTCDIPAEKVKPVKRVLREVPSVLPELIALAEWMHDRYLCNLVDALRLMIPAEMRSGRVAEKLARYVRCALSDEEIEAYKRTHKRAVKQIELLEMLKAGERPTSALTAYASALKALETAGAVTICAREQRRTPTDLKHTAAASDPKLMRGQERAVSQLTDALEHGGGRYLLHGVTGSGKTEVYIRVIRRALQIGKTAIVLVPEIALTPQMVRWFHSRFGEAAAVLHSGLSAGERFDEWRRIRSGEARVVIGARSAIFAPIEHIGVIVVDEEHENTYQSDHRPRYDAREVARHRAEAHGAVLILGSATPAVSTYMRVMPGVRPENRYQLVELRERVMGRPLPEAHTIDMRGEFERGNHSIFSGALSAALQSCVEEGHQAMLFINRRGYSTFVSCRACGYVVKCANCSVSMTYHRAENRLRCHYCGSELEPPTRCPSCGSKYIKYFGSGTQKVQEEAQLLLPGVCVDRMDVDTTQAKDAHTKILDRFRSGETRVLVGTQMITKGLDFPNVTLVGVVAADLSLNLPDYRSAERTFQLITQVAGRAGRADLPGRVIVQTYTPEHYAIQCAVNQDYRAFYNKESDYRRQALYPPFTQIARIVFSAKNPERARAAAADAETAMNLFLDHNGLRPDVVQMRATEAPIMLLRGETRWQLFLKMYFKGDFRAATEAMHGLAEGVADDVRAELEINPVNLF